jgi:hypothetical protein
MSAVSMMSPNSMPVTQWQQGSQQYLLNAHRIEFYMVRVIILRHILTSLKQTPTDTPWLQAFAAITMGSALFWDITQRRVIILYRRFRTTYRTSLLFLDFLTLEDGTDTLWRNVGTGLPVNAVSYVRIAQISFTMNYKPTLQYPEDRSIIILRNVGIYLSIYLTVDMHITALLHVTSLGVHAATYHERLKILRLLLRNGIHSRCILFAT